MHPHSPIWRSTKYILDTQSVSLKYIETKNQQKLNITIKQLKCSDREIIFGFISTKCNVLVQLQHDFKKVIGSICILERNMRSKNE